MSKNRIINYQVNLFSKLKYRFNAAHPGQRFNAHLADHFAVNEETVRRWTKGEAAIDLDLVERICKIHGSTLHELNDVKLYDKLQASYNFLGHESYSFETYLGNLAKTLEFGTKLPKLTLHYSAKDLPIFYYFYFKELAAFKIFVWRKFILCEPELKKQEFHPDLFDHSNIMQDGKRALHYYNKLHSIEVWNDETINSVIKQILHLVDMMEMSKETGEEILTQLKTVIDHIEDMAELGHRFDAESPNIKNGPFELYHNEIVLCDNSVILDMGEQIRTYIPFQTLNLMQIDDLDFGKRNLEQSLKLQKKFDKLSHSNEAHRRKVFSRMRTHINKAIITLK